MNYMIHAKWPILLVIGKKPDCYFQKKNIINATLMARKVQKEQYIPQ